MKKALVLSGGGGRGAYQVGAYRALNELGYYPNIISGTSIGAINASLIVSGFSPEKLESLWLSLHRKDVFRVSFWKRYFSKWAGQPRPLFNTKPLQNLLAESLDIAHIRENKTEIFVPAISIQQARLSVFTNHDITVEHVMASAAIPLVFPAIPISGEYYWDGGLMANTPLLPVLDAGATDISIVLLSPYAKGSLVMPKSRFQALEHVLDIILASSFRSLIKAMDPERVGAYSYKVTWKGNPVTLRIIEPAEHLGLGTILALNKEKTKELIDLGYQDALQVIRSGNEN